MPLKGRGPRPVSVLHTLKDGLDYRTFVTGVGIKMSNAIEIGSNRDE